MRAIKVVHNPMNLYDLERHVASQVALADNWVRVEQAYCNFIIWSFCTDISKKKLWCHQCKKKSWQFIYWVRWFKQNAVKLYCIALVWDFLVPLPMFYSVNWINTTTNEVRSWLFWIHQWFNIKFISAVNSLII